MRILSIIAVICFLVSSCSYSSDEYIFVEVDIDKLPNIEITSNLDISDTIEITDSIFFKYEILLDTGNIFFSQLFFDDVHIYYSEQMTDSIWINPTETMSNGSYELYMEVLYKSATGSLADRIDAEFLLKDTAWQIVIGIGEVVK